MAMKRKSVKIKNNALKMKSSFRHYHEGRHTHWLKKKGGWKIFFLQKDSIVLNLKVLETKQISYILMFHK